MFARRILKLVGGIEATEPPPNPIAASARRMLFGHAVELARASLGDLQDLADRWNTLGLALYCSEDYDGTWTALQKEYELRGEGDAINWLCLALTEHARGNDDRALDW